MTEDQLKNKTTHIICGHSNRSIVEPEENLLNDLGMSDLDVMAMMMDLEEAFSIEIGDSQIEEIHTVGDVTAFIIENVEAI